MSSMHVTFATRRRIGGQRATGLSLAVRRSLAPSDRPRSSRPPVWRPGPASLECPCGAEETPEEPQLGLARPQALPELLLVQEPGVEHAGCSVASWPSVGVLGSAPVE